MNYCCCRKTSKTKCTTIQQYVDLYSGPEFNIFKRYAVILNIVFVTMMYGFPIPALFIIALFSFINFYILDKYFITYYYKTPQVFDHTLNDRALELL